ncbi:hypothetical protein GCM10028793_54920 [Nocardiopsis oceani]
MRREEARDALEQAEALDAKVRGRGGWYLGYAVVFSVTSFILLVSIGLFQGTPAPMAASVLFGVTVLVLLAWMFTRPVTPRRFGWIHTFSMLGWGTVYGATIMVGSEHFPGDPAWWITGAALSTVPLLLAGFIDLRLSRSKK